MIGRFYWDMEFTNGNYYLTDILEIAVVVEESGNIYDIYLKIRYSVPRQVQWLTGITNRTINTHGVPLRDVMGGLRAFIQREATEPVIIIAHGGYVYDFPILLASCMKHNYIEFAVLAELVYVDSMQNLEDVGVCVGLYTSVGEGENTHKYIYTYIYIYTGKAVNNRMQHGY